MKLYDEVTDLLEAPYLPAKFSVNEALKEIKNVRSPKKVPSTQQLTKRLRLDPRVKIIGYVNGENGVKKGVWSFVE